jgi:hypothetical protein
VILPYYGVPARFDWNASLIADAPGLSFPRPRLIRSFPAPLDTPSRFYWNTNCVSRFAAGA